VAEAYIGPPRERWEKTSAGKHFSGEETLRGVLSEKTHLYKPVSLGGGEGVSPKTAGGEKKIFLPPSGPMVNRGAPQKERQPGEKIDPPQSKTPFWGKIPRVSQPQPKDQKGKKKSQ